MLISLRMLKSVRWFLDPFRSGWVRAHQLREGVPLYALTFKKWYFLSLVFSPFFKLFLGYGNVIRFGRLNQSRLGAACLASLLL